MKTPPKKEKKSYLDSQVAFHTELPDFAIPSFLNAPNSKTGIFSQVINSIFEFVSLRAIQIRPEMQGYL